MIVALKHDKDFPIGVNLKRLSNVCCVAVLTLKGFTQIVLVDGIWKMVRYGPWIRIILSRSSSDICMLLLCR